MTELQSLIILILVGFLPSEVWRWLGLVLGRGLDEKSEIILWVRGVATALIAAVVARIIFIPPGTLAIACRCRCGLRRWRLVFSPSCSSAARPSPAWSSARPF